MTTRPRSQTDESTRSFGATVASNIPIPDPTVITTEQINKAKEELRRELTEKITNLRDLLETRFEAMDKALQVLAGDNERAPTLLDREVTRITDFFNEKIHSVLDAIEKNREFYIEKFTSVQLQFRERDVRTDQDKLAATTAVNAALQAQKEAAAAQNIANDRAINKSETGFTKEIDGLKSLIISTKESIDGKIADLTGRVNRGEASGTGVRDYRVETANSHYMNTSSIIGIIGGVVGALSLGIVAVTALHASSAPAPTVVSPAVIPVTPK